MWYFELVDGFWSAGVEESAVINKRPEPLKWNFYRIGTNDAGQLEMKISVMKEKAAYWDKFLWEVILQG